ncbi:MAG: AAA family ATPase [Gammaproteobacteria bacterium]
MKIDSVRFKNINSLKGEWEVNFNQPPLSAAGVFAITGPNGSGKSTILDAITLGLFGETPKFDHPAAHVMTKQTDESFSEVVFSLDGETFRSSWSVTRSGGKLSIPEMQIVRVDEEEEILERQTGKVRSFIADLTGMDFRRFTRTVMLAQGDFAAFLNALDSERMDILEKIISADVYADVKKNVLDALKEEKGRLDGLKDDLAAIPLMAPEKTEALEHDLIEFQERLEDLQETRSGLEGERQWFCELEEKEREIADLEESIGDNANVMEQMHRQIERILKIENIESLEEEITALDEKENDLNEGKSTLAAYRSEIAQLKSSLSRLGADTLPATESGGGTVQGQIQNLDELRAGMERMSAEKESETAQLEALEKQIGEKKTVQATVHGWLGEHDADKCLVDNFPDIEELRNVRRQLKTLKEKQQAYSRQEREATLAIRENQTILEKRQKTVENLRQELKDLENDLKAVGQGYTEEQIDGLMTDQRDRVGQFQKLLDIALSHEKLDAKAGAGWLRWFGEDSDENVTEEEKKTYEALLEALEQERQIKAALDKAVIFEERLRKHAADRRHLVDGEPCPLCGSEQHPYAVRMPPESDSRKAVEAQQVKLNSLEKKAAALAVRIKAAQQREQQRYDTEQKKKILQSEWLSMCNRLNKVSDEFGIGDIRRMKKMLADEKSELKSLDALAKKIISIKTRMRKISEKLEKQKAVAAQLRNGNERLNQEWKNAPEEIRALEESLAASLEREKKASHAVIEQLAPIGEKMPAAGKEDEMIARLNQRCQDYRTYSVRRRDLERELSELTLTAEKTRQNLEDLSRRLQECGARLRSAEIAGLHLALIEKQKLAQEKESLIAAQQNELIGLKKSVSDKAQSSGVSGLAEAREIIDLKHIQPEMETKFSELEQENRRAGDALKEKKRQLASFRDSPPSERSREEIESLLKANAEKISIAEQEIAHAESVLEEQQALRNQAEEMEKQIERQEAVYAQCREDARVLDIDNGPSFRKNVRQLMVDKLLSSTNRVLEKISGRYFIRQTESEQGLALKIEDAAQNNVQRLPKTLSGGESFVVSLALALGLSELANDGRSVDSLFLDEGFGALDEETLYIVLSTLDNLHRSGKRVGVISHVKGLKERIKTQIQMSKKQNGISSMEIVA